LVAAAVALSRRPPHETAAGERDLAASFAALFAQGDEAALQRALRGAPDPATSRTLYAALARVIDGFAAGAAGAAVRAFALPVVFVAGAAKRTVVPGVLPDAAAIAAIFERRGVIGQTRNFGLSNALVPIEALQALSPLVAWLALTGTDVAALHSALPPADIEVDAGREQAHLRFLVGAGIVAADAPSFAETAANVAMWGKECSQALGRALAQPGLQVLALPRPPVDLVRAPHAGRDAALEIALHLFVSNAVRRIRLQVGDPTAIVSTHDDGDLRVTLSSVFADDLIDGFRWPLDPQDDLPALEQRIAGLLAEVRLGDVRVHPSVLPSERPGGGLWFPRAAEWDALSGDRRH